MCLSVYVEFGQGEGEQRQEGRKCSERKGEVADPALFTDQLSKGAI